VFLHQLLIRHSIEILLLETSETSWGEVSSAADCLRHVVRHMRVHHWHLLQVHHWHSLAHLQLAHSSATHHHHHLQILQHLKGVHLLGIWSLSRFVQVLVLEFRHV